MGAGNSMLGWRPPTISTTADICPIAINTKKLFKNFEHFEPTFTLLSPKVQKTIQKTMDKYGENANNGTDEILYKTDDISALANVKSNDTNKIEPIAILGNGFYGIAILIKNKETNTYYVAKRLYSKECKIIDEQLDTYIDKEIYILKYINTKPELENYVPKLKAYIKHTPGDAAKRLIHYNIENSKNNINISKIHKNFKYKPVYYEIITDYYEGLSLLDFVLLFNELCTIHLNSLRNFGRSYRTTFQNMKVNDLPKYINFLKLIRLLKTQTVPTDILDYSVEENILLNNIYTHENIGDNPNNKNKRILFDNFITTIINLYSNSIEILQLLFNIGVYHKDIKPDNLYVYLKKQPNNKYIPTLLFLDFGGSIHDRITAEDTTDSANIGYSKNKHSFGGTIIYTHPILIKLYKKYDKIWYHDIFDEYSLYKSWKSIIDTIKHETDMYNNIKLFSANIKPLQLNNLYDTIYKIIENKLYIIDNQITKYANYIIRTMTGGKRRLNKTYKNSKNTHKTYKNKRK